MKRILIVFGVLLLLTACGKDKAQPTGDASPAAPEATADASASDVFRSDGTAEENAEVQEIAQASTPTEPTQSTAQPQPTEAQHTQSTAAAPDTTQVSAAQTPAPNEAPGENSAPPSPTDPPPVSGPTTEAVPEDADDKPIEYYFPALMERQNMDKASLYRAYYFMTQYPQYQGTFVQSFEEDNLGPNTNGWGQFRVTLHTDRGDYSVVQLEDGRFVSDNMQ